MSLDMILYVMSLLITVTIYIINGNIKSLHHVQFKVNHILLHGIISSKHFVVILSNLVRETFIKFTYSSINCTKLIVDYSAKVFSVSNSAYNIKSTFKACACCCTVKSLTVKKVLLCFYTSSK